MELLVLAYATFAFAIVTLAFSSYGRRVDHKRKRIENISGLSETMVYQELDQSFYKRFIEDKVKKIKNALKKMLPQKKEKQKAKINKNKILERQLRLAGMYITPQEFTFGKMVFISLFILFVVFFAFMLDTEDVYRLLIVLVGLMMAILLPTLFLRARVDSRQQKIKEQLADTFDLLSVCIEAGLSFDAALVKISEKFTGPFIDELMIVYREIQMGRSRRDALQNLCSCSDIQELKTFASALVQAEQLGIPINNVMRTQSKQLRETRRQQAKEKGMKASIKMMIPMLFFIFPVVFIIILGPTVINLIEQFA